jgi:hypothetical protein
MTSERQKDVQVMSKVAVCRETTWSGEKYKRLMWEDYLRNKIPYCTPETDRLLKYCKNNVTLSINTPVNFYLNTRRHIAAHFYFKIQNIFQESFL